LASVVAAKVEQLNSVYNVITLTTIIEASQFQTC